VVSAADAAGGNTAAQMSRSRAGVLHSAERSNEFPLLLKWCWTTQSHHGRRCCVVSLVVRWPRALVIGCCTTKASSEKSRKALK